jgi:hypothetical protein
MVLGLEFMGFSSLIVRRVAADERRAALLQPMEFYMQASRLGCLCLPAASALQCTFTCPTTAPSGCHQPHASVENG